MTGELSKVRQRERLAGLLLIAAAGAALALANSPLGDAYDYLVHLQFGPAMPRFGVMNLHEWVADGLMAIFFLLVGLEVKREWYDGRLATAEQRRLPIVAAIGGVVVPALIYLYVIGGDPGLARGWAIPSATDIAFAVGILALLGDRSNPAVKLLLVTIAIIDDVAAVLIIALVYTAQLDVMAIGAAAILLVGMATMNLLGVRRLWPFLVGFALLWFAMMASGIHPTIAGVLAAFTIPLGKGERVSPLLRLEHAIHPWVSFGIMPLFGFVSAGVHVGSADELLQPPAVAIMLGLFFGKQIGVFGTIWLMVRSGLSAKPGNARWSELYGASLLCGIGFTMSLFIGALAFPESPAAVEGAKLGTLAGSLLSAICGYALLRTIRPSPISERDREQAREIFGQDPERTNRKGQPRT